MLLWPKLSLPGFAARSGSGSAAARLSHQRHLDKGVSIRSSISLLKHRAQPVCDATSPDFYRADLLTAAEVEALLRGPASSSVLLRVRARGGAERELYVQRRPLPQPAVREVAATLLPTLPSIIASFHCSLVCARLATCAAVRPGPPAATLSLHVLRFRLWRSSNQPRAVMDQRHTGVASLDASAASAAWCPSNTLW